MSVPAITNATPSAVTNANVIACVTNFTFSASVASALSAARTAHPGSDSALMDILNAPVSGLYVAGDVISSSDFFDLVDASEWDVMTQAELASLSSLREDGNVKMGSSSTQDKINLLFDSKYPASLAASQAKYVRMATPWEVYFGKGLAAAQQILDDARNSGAGNNF